MTWSEKFESKGEVRSLRGAIFVAAWILGAITIGGAAESAPKAIFPDAAPVCSCESLAKVELPNTTIESAAIDPTNGWCRVTATVTHPPSGDRVKVWIGLPVTNWNGRFRGNGGGGYVGGSPGTLRGSVALGYAAG